MSESYGKRPGFEVLDRVATVELRYPKQFDNCHTVQIALEDVRAADAVRVSYDFDRDGWLIEQEKLIEFDPVNSLVLGTGRWVEVAFVQAWGLERTVDEADPEDVKAARALHEYED